MTRSGQCPHCHRIHAVEQASVSAAPSSGAPPSGKLPTAGNLACDCGLNFVVQEFADGDTIALCCAKCQREYVVDQMAAGEALPCCCGAEMVVPAVQLVPKTEAAEPPIAAHQQDPPANTTSFNRQPQAHASPPTNHPNQHPSTPTQQPPTDATSFNRQPQAHASPPQEHPDQHHSTPAQQPPTDATSLNRQPKAHASPPQELPDPHTSTPAQQPPADTTSSFNRQPQAHASPPQEHPDPHTSTPAQQPPADTTSSFNRQPKAHASPPTNDPDAPEPPQQSRSLLVALPIVSSPALFSISIPTITCSSPQDPGTTHDIESIASEPTEPSLAEPKLAPEPERIPDQPDQSADESTSTFAVSCAGCKAEYVLDRGDINHTAECECGFVFIIRENVDAIDNALAMDPVTELPVMPDRTGTDRTNARGSATVESAADVLTESMDCSDPSTRKRKLTRWEIAVMALLLLGLGTIYAATQSPRGDAVTIAEVSTPGGRPNHAPRPRTITRSKVMEPIEELIQEFEPLPSLSRPELHRFAEAVIQLDDQRDTLQLNDLIWLATQWETFGDRAATPDLASKCFRQASAAYALAEANLGNESDQRLAASRRSRELLQKSESIRQIARKSEVNVSR